MDNLKQLSLFIVLIVANYLIVTKATPQIKPVLKGDRATLACNVDQRSYNFVTWTKAGILISVNRQSIQNSLKDRYEIMETSTQNYLYIENVRETNQDVFTCKKGTTELRQWQLVIELKPHILEQFSSPRTLNVTEGDDLTLWCNATGKPEPRITWLRQRSDDARAPIRDSGITGPWLLIRNAIRYAADLYICNATNKYESALWDILVQVRSLTTSTKAKSPIVVEPTTSAEHPQVQSEQGTVSITLIAVISANAAVELPALTTSTQAESPIVVEPTTSAEHPQVQSDQGKISITLIAVSSAAAAVVFVIVTFIVILILFRRRRKLSTKKTLRPTVSVENSRRQSSTQDQGVANEDVFIMQPQTKQYEVLQMTPQVSEGDVVSSDQGDGHLYTNVHV